MKLVIHGLSEGCILTVLSGIVSSIIVSIIEVKASIFPFISSAAYTSDQSSRITFLLRAFKFSVVKSLTRLGKAGNFSLQGVDIHDQNAQVVADGASDYTCLAYSSEPDLRCSFLCSWGKDGLL